MRGFPAAADGYAGSLSCTREVSAVTGACLAIGRGLYEEAGGLDERFATHYQDVDLCLRLGGSGGATSIRRAQSYGTTRALPAGTTTTGSIARCSSTRGARRSRAATRTTAGGSRSRARTTGRSPHERALRQLPRLQLEQRRPHLQPGLAARRGRRRVCGRGPGRSGARSHCSATSRSRRSTSPERGTGRCGFPTASRPHSSMPGRRGNQFDG